MINLSPQENSNKYKGSKENNNIPTRTHPRVQNLIILDTEDGQFGLGHSFLQVTGMRHCPQARLYGGYTDAGLGAALRLGAKSTSA